MLWLACNGDMYALLNVEASPGLWCLCRGSDISEWNALVYSRSSCRVGRRKMKICMRLWMLKRALW